MSKSSALVFIVLGVLGYLVSPVALILGWNQLVKAPKSKTIASIVSLVGLILASCSALLAILTIAYAHGHHCGFYDPVLMRFLAFGILLSAVVSA